MNGNGKTTTFPRLSDSLADELRCMIHRHEPAYQVAECLENLSMMLLCVRREDARVRWLNAQLDIYKDAEALFGEVG